MLTLRNYLTSQGKYPGFEKEFASLPEDKHERYTKNAKTLISKVSLLFSRAGIVVPILTSSGWRPISHHLAIYAGMGIPKEKVPMGSAHLSCEAIDVLDPSKDIGRLATEILLEECDLYMESLSVTHKSMDPSGRWVHFQTKKTASGNRIFLP